MLTQYLSQTSALLQNPPATPPLYSDTLLTGFINTARGQLAGESQSIRVLGSLTTATNDNSYDFSAITLSAAGVQGVINVRTIWSVTSTGQTYLAPRAFEWFSLYNLNADPTPLGPPAEWSQYGQGASAQGSPLPVDGGSLFISPTPDNAYNLSLDCVCYPVPLVDDTTSEALPYLWTDAVPYFAAYLALMSAQTGARDAMGQRMLERYQFFAQRAKMYAVPGVLPGLYPQQMPPQQAPQRVA